jgi:hypothetical protein
VGEGGTAGAPRDLDGEFQQQRGRFSAQNAVA